MHPCTDRQGKTWHRPALLALNLAWLSLAAPVAEAAPWKIRADTQVQLELRQVGWRLQGPFAEQRVELVEVLTRAAWAMTGEPWPSLPRDQWPVRVRRLGEPA